MGLSVRLANHQLDNWFAIPGESGWIDYSCQQHVGELIVYIHSFRRMRERVDLRRDVLVWKPGTTNVAHRYGAGEWTEVLEATQVWPPAEVEYVPRRHRDLQGRGDRAPRPR